jgi:hypothetical protein
MRWLLCAALLVLVAPLRAQEPAAQEPAAQEPAVAIDDCIARLDPLVDIGFDRISARCPDLARTLEQSGIAEWLPQGWKESRNNLSAGSLAELRKVLERETATRPTARVPRVEALNDVLATLGDTRKQNSGVWSRFKKWVRDLMERKESPEGESWFDHMVSRVGISAALREIITYVALGAMVLLALIVVLNELKAAGLLGRRGADANRKIIPTASLLRPLPKLADIERAPLIERPRMLLELISAKLTALRRLPPASALTVRELAKSVVLQDAEDRQRLSQLALTAERARYAESGVPADALESAFEQGRALLKNVETLQAPEPASGARA